MHRDQTYSSDSVSGRPVETGVSRDSGVTGDSGDSVVSRISGVLGISGDWVEEEGRLNKEFDLDWNLNLDLRFWMVTGDWVEVVVVSLSEDNWGRNLDLVRNRLNLPAVVDSVGLREGFDSGVGSDSGVGLDSGVGSDSRLGLESRLGSDSGVGLDSGPLQKKILI